MNNACIASAVPQPYVAAPAQAYSSAGAAPLEALARALGYTEKELAFAADALSRFSWHAPSRPVRGTVQPVEGDEDDSSPDRKRAA